MPGPRCVMRWGGCLASEHPLFQDPLIEQPHSLLVALCGSVPEGLAQCEIHRVTGAFIFLCRAKACFARLTSFLPARKRTSMKTKFSLQVKAHSRVAPSEGSILSASRSQGASFVAT